MPFFFAFPQVRHLLGALLMYARASIGLRRSVGGVCVSAGDRILPWCPLVSAALPLAFAWQVRRLVLCKQSDVRPGVPWSLPLCRWLLGGRHGAWCTACSARGRMYALASLSLRRSAGGFCVSVFCILSDVCPGVPLNTGMCVIASIYQCWLCTVVRLFGATR